MATKLRVAGVGCGYFSQFHYQAWRRLDVELVAIAERDPDKARLSAAQFSVPRVYDDAAAMVAREQPDLLDLVTPPPTHLALIEIAAANGIDVICQKPFTTGLDDARRALEIAAEAGITLVVHENFRFQPWYREIAALLQQGALGQVYHASFRLRPGDGQGADAYLDRQPGFREMPRFLINETAVHLVDVFRFLFGEIRAVYAELQQLNPAIRGEDAGQVLFEFESGTRAIFDGNRLADHAAANRRLTMGEMRIDGSDGEIALDGDGAIRRRRFGENDWHAVDYRWDDIGFGGDCVYRLQQHVIEHLGAATPPENTAAAYLANLEVVAAIYRAAASGCRVELKPG